MNTPAVVSVLGQDRVGIVAEVATILAESNANIEDIRQSILDGIFSMTMLVTLDESATPFDVVQSRLTETSATLGVQIQIQRTDVFKMMHRI